MNYQNMKKLIASFVKPKTNNNKLISELDEAFQGGNNKIPNFINTSNNDYCPDIIPPITIVKVENKHLDFKKYVTDKKHISYRGAPAINDSNKQPLYHGMKESFMSLRQLEKDKLTQEAVAHISDISKLLLREFEEGRLVYVAQKPVPVSLLTRVKMFLKLK